MVSHRFRSTFASARTPIAPSVFACDRSDYEAVRSDAKQFLVLPLHYTPEIETLVAEHEQYWVVRKTGDAGEYVEHLDPRSR